MPMWFHVYQYLLYTWTFPGNGASAASGGILTVFISVSPVVFISAKFSIENISKTAFGACALGAFLCGLS